MHEVLRTTNAKSSCNVDADRCEYDVVLSPGDPEHSLLTAAGESILSALRPLATLVTSAAADSY
jgi:hypothetical protein